jgi:hypothetical protein
MEGAASEGGLIEKPTCTSAIGRAPAEYWVGPLSLIRRHVRAAPRASSGAKFYMANYFPGLSTLRDSFGRLNSAPTNSRLKSIVVRRLLPIVRNTSNAVLTISGSRDNSALCLRDCNRRSADRLRMVRAATNAETAANRKRNARTRAAVTVPNCCCVHTNNARQKKKNAATPVTPAATAKVTDLIASSSLSFRLNIQDCDVRRVNGYAKNFRTRILFPLLQRAWLGVWYEVRFRGSHQHYRSPRLPLLRLRDPCR